MDRRTTRRPDRGQSLVEFALVLPLFLLLIFGVIDGGRAIFAWNQMSQVARAVARVASTNCFPTGWTTACDKNTGAIAAAIVSQGAGFQGPVTWTVTCINPTTGAVPAGTDHCQVGYLVRATVSMSFTLSAPVASSFGPVNVGSKTEQEILQ